MHIKRIQTSLPCFLLLAQFIVDTKVPIWVGLATFVLKEWHKGTNVHHSMKACACIKGTPHFPLERKKEFYDTGKGWVLVDGPRVA